MFPAHNLAFCPNSGGFVPFLIKVYRQRRPDDHGYDSDNQNHRGKAQGEALHPVQGGGGGGIPQLLQQRPLDLRRGVGGELHAAHAAKITEAGHKALGCVEYGPEAPPGQRPDDGEIGRAHV